ncbi:cation diffusion facilitator family transporter [Saccharibacter sp. 17.LH.SD]|uniref:cation diffusion facilitator family transporter n=1 Tax=Saccharibacter sp. 17.LH.SD TaxID=2689393 RepID=UPI00136E215C|nr:cation diffusion facilitator family transporter [Saccharibacter sp. 17.LH.SD]MXV43878.1 cation diffusion facilitator family transporter [Saccharibacter sp. 17.LH.SD]
MSSHNHSPSSDHASHSHHDEAHHHHDDDHTHHDHHHGFGHHHTHTPASFGAIFLIGMLLNSAYIIGETTWGFWSHSLSLLADAGHNLSDVLSLAATWFAQILAKRAPTQQFTYGLKRATILTALGNAIILLLVTGGIIWEAIIHLFHPAHVEGLTVSSVALIGIFINGGTALLFMRGASHDLNMRGAFLHMASDALMALSVVIAGGLITLTGYNIIDPIVSLVVASFIIWSTWSLLTQSLELALDAVPTGINVHDVEAALRALPNVADVHHLHIWPMSTTETALTVHLVQPPPPETSSLQDAAHTTQTLLRRASTLLQERFSIQHPTFQIETQGNPLSCSTGTCSIEGSSLSHDHVH